MKVSNKIEVNGKPIKLNVSEIAHDGNTLDKFLSYGNAVNLTLQNGWTGDLKVRKNGLGLVHLYGEITPGVTDRGTTITNLPEKHRPALQTNIIAQSANTNAGAITGLTVVGSGNLNIYGIETGNEIGSSAVRINYVFQV